MKFSRYDWYVRRGVGLWQTSFPMWDYSIPGWIYAVPPSKNLRNENADTCQAIAFLCLHIFILLCANTSLLGISSGEDLCTLVTCTPYGVNTHRLLVCGSRIPYEEAEVILEETSQGEQPQSSWMKKYIEGIIWGIVVAIGLILLIVSAVQIYRKFTNNYGGGTYAKK